jgi:hypothetical protein
MQFTVFGEDGRELPRTRYRIVENEIGLFGYVHDLFSEIHF